MWHHLVAWVSWADAAEAELQKGSEVSSWKGNCFTAIILIRTVRRRISIEINVIEMVVWVTG